MISCALFGCGRIGQVHAGSLATLEIGSLVAVVDAFPDAAESLASQYQVATSTVDSVMANTDIDAVIIATPTDTHFDLIQRSAAAGKAIFCEKPIDMSTENIRLCRQAVAAAGIPFFTGFNRRFDPNFAGLRNQIRDGAIGQVEQVMITSRDPGPPPISYIKSSGGIFRDMMIHDLDMARFLMAEEPESLHAVGSCMIDPAIGEAGDFDTAAVTMRTAGGIICQISNSRRATYGYDQRIEVHGSKGMVRVDNVLENSVEIAGAEGFRKAPTMNFFLERYIQAYRMEMAYFVETIRSGGAMQPSIDDGLRAQILADAADQSARDGEMKKVQVV